MTRRLRRIARHATLAALAASLCVTALPGVASARRDHDHDDSDSGYAEHDGIDYRAYRPHRRQRAHHRRHQRRPYPVYYRGDSCRTRVSPIGARFHRPSYVCQPCRHRFGSRSRLHRHLHRRHRIPAWQLPHVILHSGLDWIFHG